MLKPELRIARCSDISRQAKKMDFYMQSLNVYVVRNFKEFKNTMRAKQNTSAVQVGPAGCQFRTPGLEERCGLLKVT